LRAVPAPRAWLALAVLGGLAACAPVTPVAPPDPAASEVLPLFGGYRSPEDPCQRIGESAETNNFLDDAADLVGCPEGSAEAAGFAAATGARPLGLLEGYALFSVPRR
jgi:hypothetical protein